MVTQTIAITPTSDRTHAIATIAAAFRDDPVCRWVWPGDAQYDAWFAPFVDAFAGAAFDAGTAHAADGFAGVALWLPPGTRSDDDALGVIADRSIDDALKDEAFAFLGQQAELHPHEPHWYLPLIGVAPAHRGRGLGSALLEHALRTVDEQHLPAYLEATSPRNKALYERHGFASTGAVIQAGFLAADVAHVAPRALILCGHGDARAWCLRRSPGRGLTTRDLRTSASPR